MNRESAEQFANDWINGWNTHDLQSILSHYSDDFEMSSPVITQVTGNPDGVLKGKQAVGEYWSKALQLFPDLKFTHICTLLGMNSVVIHYYGATGKRVAEVFTFNSAGLVCKAHAHYE